MPTHSRALPQLRPGARATVRDLGEETPLAGGMGNDGLVVRVGDTVRRPWGPASPATQALLARLAETLPGVAPTSLGRDEQGRGVTSWLDGEVALHPFPAWAASDRFLASLGRLLRRVHDALDGWVPPDHAEWSGELADPAGGSLVVHADICPENVVARDGEAVGLLDWEFAAPGRRVWDVVSTARLCVPFVSPGRREVGERFVRARLAAGQPSFVARWAGRDGDASHPRESLWLQSAQTQVAHCLSLP